MNILHPNEHSSLLHLHGTPGGDSLRSRRGWLTPLFASAAVGCCLVATAINSYASHPPLSPLMVTSELLVKQQNKYCFDLFSLQ